MGEEGRRRGVEQAHSSILQRRQETDVQRGERATDIFERSVASCEGEVPPEVVTVDFLRKYLRFCKRFTPILNEEAQIRLATAHAKLKLRKDWVLPEDVHEAYKLMM